MGKNTNMATEVRKAPRSPAQHHHKPNDQMPHAGRNRRPESRGNATATPSIYHDPTYTVWIEYQNKTRKEIQTGLNQVAAQMTLDAATPFKGNRIIMTRDGSNKILKTKEYQG